MGERPKPEQVANLKKDSPTKEFLKRFINTDLEAIKNDWIEERLMPGIYDLGQFLWDKLWEKDGRPTTRSSIKGNNRVAYHAKFRYKSEKQDTGNNETDYTEISKPRYDEIVVESRDDVIKIIDSMNSYIARYGEFDRGQLYSLIGVTADFQDAKWGWKRERWDTPTFRRVRDGYLLIFPPIMHLTEE